MIISPCAMLMTPITPKVMARPIAAINRMLPRLSPWNRLAAMPVSWSRRAIEAAAPSGGLFQRRVEPGAFAAVFVEQVAHLRVGAGAERGDRLALLVRRPGEKLRRLQRPLHRRAHDVVMLVGDDLLQ